MRQRKRRRFASSRRALATYGCPGFPYKRDADEPRTQQTIFLSANECWTRNFQLVHYRIAERHLNTTNLIDLSNFFFFFWRPKKTLAPKAMEAHQHEIISVLIIRAWIIT